MELLRTLLLLLCAGTATAEQCGGGGGGDSPDLTKPITCSGKFPKCCAGAEPGLFTCIGADETCCSGTACVDQSTYCCPKMVNPACPGGDCPARCCTWTTTRRRAGLSLRSRVCRPQRTDPRRGALLGRALLGRPEKHNSVACQPSLLVKQALWRSISSCRIGIGAGLSLSGQKSTFLRKRSRSARRRRSSL